MSKLHVALAHAKRGFAVFPLAVGQKAPPLLADWPNKATSDPAEVEMLWAAVPHANVGIHCRGMVVLDVDPDKAGEASLAALQDLYSFPSTLTVRTPSGGRHFYFSLPDGSPGVSNTVSKLGPGLDIRSTGGYVVAAGSDLEVGRYHFADPKQAIAPVPEWLLTLLVPKTGTNPPKTGTSAVPDAPESAYSNARAWLEAQAPAIEGQGGDAYTFGVACGLRDRGVSESQAVELLTVWNEKCQPPWELADLQAKAHNAYRYGQNPPGVRVALPQDFPVVEPTARQDSSPLASALRRVRALSALNPGPALWEGVIPERAVFAIGALPGRSKSYTATGLVYALATDAGEYLGRAIPTGTAAVYVDVERLSTTELRVSVWCHADGRDPANLPLLLTDGLRLNAPETVKALIESLHAAKAGLGGRRISLVIFDSLGATLPGQELNSSSPATMAGTQLRRIRDSLGCAVGVVSHSPKSGDETVAGSLHFDAIFDATVFVRSEDGATGTLYVKKDNGLALEEEERSTHWQRETITALVGDRAVRVHRLVAGTAMQSNPRRIAGNYRRAFEVLCGLSSDNSPVALEAWRDGCKEFLSERNFAKRFYDIKTALLEKGYISVNSQGMVSRPLQ